MNCERNFSGFWIKKCHEDMQFSNIKYKMETSRYKKCVIIVSCELIKIPPGIRDPTLSQCH